MKISLTRAAGAVLLALSFAPSAVLADDDVPITTKLVDTMTTLAHGPYPGFRANHAKGIMASGTFTPAPGAAKLSKAAHLHGKPVPVLVRFSDPTGVPVLPDADPNATPHGMAIRFQISGDDKYTDIVALGHNGFPVATPEDFLALLTAIGASGPGVAHPTPIEQFLGSHPTALKYVKSLAPAPQSFTTVSYFGINAFKFTNAQGKTQYGRYQIRPVGGEHFLTSDQAAKAAPDYLVGGLDAQLKKAPAKFRISVQLAAEGDNLTDGSSVWPDDRPQIVLGTLTLKKVLPDSKEQEKQIMFSPLNLVEGIEGSDDPILNARPIAYSVSYGRRQ